MKMLFSVALASLFMGCTSEPLIVHTYEVTFVLAGSKEDTKEYKIPVLSASQPSVAYNDERTVVFVQNENGSISIEKKTEVEVD